MGNTAHFTDGATSETEAVLKMLGSTIRAERCLRGLTLQQLADRVLVSAAIIGSLERASPSVSVGILATTLTMLGIGNRLADVAQPARGRPGSCAECPAYWRS